MKWLGIAAIAFGTIIAFGMTQSLMGSMPEDDPASEFFGQAVFTLVVLTVPIAVGLGIVRYRLYELDILVSRAFVYAGLALFLVAGYVIAVLVAGVQLGRWAGSSTIAALTATAAVAVAFHPVRLRLHRAASRLVFGARAEPYALMTRLARELGQATEPADTLARVAQAVADAVPPATVRVTVDLGDGEVLAATVPITVTAAPWLEALPVTHQGERVGEIAVGDRRLTGADRAVVTRIASVSASAMHGLRLLARLRRLHTTIDGHNRELAASRQRLVDAARAERQRVQHLIADRLTPRLIEVHNGLTTLGGEADPQVLALSARYLAGEAAQLVDEMRDIARGILPPLLADQGLAAALRAMLRRFDGDVALDLAPDVAETRFPPPVETTVFLCCQAALPADPPPRQAEARVRVWRDGDALAFTIAASHPAPGALALTGLHDRLATLGGALDTRTADGRLVVTGHVPVG
jgi:hypothetical protein